MAADESPDQRALGAFGENKCCDSGSFSSLPADVRAEDEELQTCQQSPSEETQQLSEPVVSTSPDSHWTLLHPAAPYFIITADFKYFSHDWNQYFFLFTQLPKKYIQLSNKCSRVKSHVFVSKCSAVEVLYKVADHSSKVHSLTRTWMSETH